MLKQELLYKKIAAIQETIVDLENLTAIFSQANDDRIIHVYNYPKAYTPRTSSNVLSILLDNLLEVDLSVYDGPAIGFTGLDLLREDLLTKGPLFYPIERVFSESGHIEELNRTKYKLAEYLLKYLNHRIKDLKPFKIEKIEAEIVKLALPQILASEKCEYLIAVVPLYDLSQFVLNGDSQFFYTHSSRSSNIKSLCELAIDTDKTWFVGLEELGLFHEQIDPQGRRFLELRPYLVQIEQAKTLIPTRQSLASLLFTRNLAEVFLPPALALVTENLLLSKETEDLVAVLPSNNIERFQKEGDAVFVYRDVRRNTEEHLERQGKVSTLSTLLEKGLPDGYDQTLISFELIYHRLQGSPPLRFIELGGLLCKLNKEPILARTLWLLVQELLENDPKDISARLPYIDIVLDSALRAYTIYSLFSPWDWRQGRWQIFLDKCYHVLQNTLKHMSELLEEPRRYFFKALNLWYGIYQTQDAESNLQEMLVDLRQYRRSCAPDLIQEEGTLLEVARKLTRIGEQALYYPTGTDSPDESGGESGIRLASVSEIIREAAQGKERLPYLSALFESNWEKLQNARARRIRILHQERNMELQIQQIKGLSSSLRRKQKQLFALAHEQKILNLAYQREIDNLETLLHELESAAKLTVTLNNRWVNLHQEVELEFEIKNIGQVAADDLEITLAHPRGFQLLETTLVREFHTLPPQVVEKFTYKMIPEKEDVEISLEYTFQDQRDQLHRDTWTSRLNVMSLDATPFKEKKDHYQFGPPIQHTSDFYGRKEELLDILSPLAAGERQNLVLLRGPRRMGKTSLMYIVKETLKEPSLRRKFGIPIEWDAELNHIHPIFISLHSFDVQPGEAEVNHFFRTLLESAAKVLSMDKASSAAMLNAYASRINEIGATYAALEQTNHVLEKYPGERMIVLLDEYDEIYHPQTSNLDRNLREFVSVEQRIAWLIASTKALYQAVKSASSPWFNVFTIMELKCLSDDAAYSLVTKPSHEENIIWHSDAVNTLLEESGCHPLFTQLLCSYIIRHLNKTKSNYVLKDTVEEVADKVIGDKSSQNYFEFNWTDPNGIGKLILLILDESEEPMKREEIRQKVFTKLQEVFGSAPLLRVKDDNDEVMEWREREFKSGIDQVAKIINTITLDNQRRHYVFTVPLFRRWLRIQRHYQDLLSETLDKISKEMEQDELAHP